MSGNDHKLYRFQLFVVEDDARRNEVIMDFELHIDGTQIFTPATKVTLSSKFKAYENEATATLTQMKGGIKVGIKSPESKSSVSFEVPDLIFMVPNASVEAKNTTLKPEISVAAKETLNAMFSAGAPIIFEASVPRGKDCKCKEAKSGKVAVTMECKFKEFKDGL